MPEPLQRKDRDGPDQAGHERAKHERICPDCGFAIADATARFCPRCAQRLELTPLGLRQVLTSALATLWSLESPLLRTTRDLLLRPGRVAHDWIKGRRRSYANPLQFIVVVGAIVALLHGPLESLQIARTRAGEAVYDASLADPAAGYFAFVCIGLLIPIALVMRVLGAALRVRRPWLEWYVLGLYAYGIGAALQLAIKLFGAFAPPGIPRIVALWLQGFAPILWLIFATAGFVDRDERVRGIALAIAGQALGLAAIVAARALT